MDTTAFKALLIKHEGYRNKAYVDTAGKVTVGVGRNLDQKGLSNAEVDYLLNNDVNDILSQVDKLSWFPYLSPNRQLVIMSLCFNIGLGGLLQFKNMIDAIIHADYMKAADELMNSKWYGQVGLRGQELVAMLRAG